MAQFLGFGNGQDGVATLSGTDAPIDSSCSGTSGTRSLSATNASFTAGQIILIHQTRGTNAGTWELNQIFSYTSGTITTTTNLTNTYTDSGASQAQVLVLKQYSGVTVSSTLTAKAWDGNVGGILAFLCSGKTTISGAINSTGRGYRGASGGSLQQQTGRQGEGTSGERNTRSTAANGSGGGGGQGGPGNNTRPAGAGGGGGHSGAGTTGGTFNGGTGGTGGSASGVTTLTTLTFGGGGGESGTRDNTDTNSAIPGAGGGIILIFSRSIVVTGTVAANGDTAVHGGAPYGNGGGAGGAVFIKAVSADIGSAKVTASGGSGSGSGGAGSAGRVRIEACSVSGTTSPTASEQEGGFDFCGSANFIM